MVKIKLVKFWLMMMMAMVMVVMVVVMVVMVAIWKGNNKGASDFG